MGSQQFTELAELDITKRNEIINRMLSYHNQENYSNWLSQESYKGEMSKIQFDNSFRSTRNESAKGDQSNESISIYNKAEKKEIEQHQGLILYKFEWKEGGNLVYIIGSFFNWNMRNQLEYKDGTHSIKLVNII